MSHKCSSNGIVFFEGDLRGAIIRNIIAVTSRKKNCAMVSFGWEYVHISMSGENSTILVLTGSGRAGTVRREIGIVGVLSQDCVELFFDIESFMNEMNQLLPEN